MSLRRFRKQLKNDIVKVGEHVTSDDTAVKKEEENEAANISMDEKSSDTPASTTETNTAINNKEEQSDDAGNLNIKPASTGQIASTTTIETKTTSTKSLIKCIRRKPNPDAWKQNIRKKLRQAGKEYVNASGHVTAERSMKPACSWTCYLKCSERFSENQRQTIHNTFWRLTDEQKNNFYWKYTARCEPKRRRSSMTASKRAYTFHYRFEVRGELMPVCGKFFFNTLDITSRRVYYFYDHCYDEDICMPREIKRGKNPKPDLPNISERLDEIREHIASIPSVRITGNTKKRYLPAHLNLTRLYEVYSKTVTDPLKQHWYNRVFNDEFNLGFRLPSKKVVHNKKRPGATYEKVKVETDSKLSEPDEVENQVSIVTNPDIAAPADATQWRKEHVIDRVIAAAVHQIQMEQPAPLTWNESNIPTPKQYTNYGWDQEY